MRNMFFSLLLTVCLVIGRGGYASTPVDDASADLLQKLMPAVVDVSVEQKSNYDEKKRIERFSGGQLFEEFREFFDRLEPFMDRAPEAQREVISFGSGFIIDPSGLIVTNSHVISNAREITVKLNTDAQFRAKIVAQDVRTDLAVLKIDSDKPLPFVKFGDSDKMRIGDSVIAIGNSFGLGASASKGVLSARSRIVSIGAIGDFLQTDAAINRGNSGGPLFNTDGEVIGINTAIFSPSGGNVGIAFAIPSNFAVPVIDVLKNGKKVEHGWLGVKMQEVTKEVADSLGMNEVQGALVAEVIKDGPAYKAGIKTGDVIIAFGGTKISKMQQLVSSVSQAAVNKPLKITVYRHGKTEDVKVIIGKLQNSEDENFDDNDDELLNTEPDYAESGKFGLKVSELSGDLRKNNNIRSDVKGVFVQKVDRSSNAFSRGIRRGDVISAVNQTEVGNVKDFNKVMSSVEQSGRKTVLLFVNRGGNSLFVSVRIN